MKITDQYAKIGARIKSSRETLGMSQTDLAMKLGFSSPTAISLIESGARRISVSGIEKVANALGIDMQYLLNGKQSNMPDIKVVLRADKDLNQDDVNAILRFVELAKERKRGKSSES